MAIKHLVVVESPAKAKTIAKYLGPEFMVLASYGHVRDLVPKDGAVEVDNDFKMHYQSIEKNKRHVDQLAKAMRRCETLYLATDPDREGEAIAWHVLSLLEERGVLKNKKIERIVFFQITKKAVNDAVAAPRPVAMDLVNAQQARRALDYLVGFQLSPLLWKKVWPGLSAGRVQSPALRMIANRESEIEAFKPQEYWSIRAFLNAKKQDFLARLTVFKGQKVEQFSFVSEAQSAEVTKALTALAKGALRVSQVAKKERKRKPTAPFITSTLQQEAARKIGFSASKTMRVAQQLYEGIDIGSETLGLITYMRTDSVTLAPEAIEDIRQVILERFGKDNLPKEPRVYKTKSKSAQEAHEAIRPTSALRHPEDMKSFLDRDQFRLYQLVWRRAVACQMVDATLHTVAVDFAVEDSVFRANGSTIVSPGFMHVYQEGLDDKQKDMLDEKMLPPLKEGEDVALDRIEGNQHFTEPPPRYTEASLVKALEEHDIGRPSTYASIINTLKTRKYVELENKRFRATDVGRVVSRFLENYFTQYVDYDFTANLENELDDVARGEKPWVPLLKSFWQPFKQLVDTTEKNVERSEVTQEKIDEACPECGKGLSKRLGRRGIFIGCTGYPDCSYTRNVGEDNKEEMEAVEGRSCPKCQHPLVVKHGRYGKFIGCSHYPECKHIEPMEKPKNTGVACPLCHKEQLLERKSRRGKVFYSCAGYPKCKYALWNQPMAEACPSCQWPILSVKVTKKRGREKLCPQAACNYLLPLGEDDADDDGE